MLLQVGVKILLKNKEGKFLLLRRSSEKYPTIDKQWDIPGGRIVPGSSLIENLLREVKEETGLEITGEPKLIAAQDILKSGKHVVRLTYTGEANGEVKLSDEHTDFKWLSKNELVQLAPVGPALKEVLGKFML